jgi:SAM-dependent methyltransferase
MSRAVLGRVERVLGIDTAGPVKLADLGISTANREDYEPSGWLDLRRILRSREISGDDVFMDLGSGKGRVLLEAAGYPFRRVIGVELSDKLNAISRANLDACAHRLRCHDVQVVTCDVADYEIPDDVTIAYMYNAFHADVFEAAITRLVESFDRRPRRFLLVYRNAVEHDRLIRSRRFRQLRVAHGLRPSLSIRMYAVEPLA